tara:strand:+ start:337 stop:1137 length:801 start_codon:yes stop_codon:yes gene_type:complete
MVSIHLKNTNANAPGKDVTFSCPATVVECPPIKILGLRFYAISDHRLTPSSFVSSSKFDKNLKLRLDLPKKPKPSNKIPEKFDEVRLVVYTQPSLTGIGKKKPEIFEIPCAETDAEKLKVYLDSEIKLTDVMQPGEVVDISAITKGKGFHGPVRRFGISLKAKKSEKKQRSAGNLGAWTPTKVSHTVPQPGQMGFFSRTDRSKHILTVGESKDNPSPKGGFKKYGVVKNDYLILKGSVPGPSKRLIMITPAQRKHHTKDVYEVDTA